MRCIVCSREMVIMKGNMCKSCANLIEEGARHRETSEMIAETIGEFSLFENGVKPVRFKKRLVLKKRVFKNK